MTFAADHRPPSESPRRVLEEYPAFLVPYHLDQLHVGRAIRAQPEVPLVVVQDGARATLKEMWKGRISPGIRLSFRGSMPTRLAPSLPRVLPIVPTARPLPFNDSAWLFEPKYDGFRGMLYLSSHSCTLYSKRGNAMKRFRELGEQVRAELHGREIILDGEIVALDDEGRISFWDLMRGRGTLAYAAFDVLWLNGRDLRHLPLNQRKKRLERLIPASVGALNRVPCFETEGCELFEAACRLDLEGIVAKRKSDPYNGKTPWYKIRNPTYTQAEGRREFFEGGTKGSKLESPE